ncbi:MAG: AbrB/MazE/SpoVT family DNA-binding domain-containing protein [Methanocellales archaeon]|nr:AbrB/MazE/SpoVT family DNA-binding domain-containing protein [Methanocellales archaeon]
MAERNVVVVDTHGRIVIPKRVRKVFKTNKFEIEVRNEKIELKPIKSLDELFGSLPELDLKMNLLRPLKIMRKA